MTVTLTTNQAAMLDEAGRYGTIAVDRHTRRHRTAESLERRGLVSIYRDTAYLQVSITRAGIDWLGAS